MAFRTIFAVSKKIIKIASFYLFPDRLGYNLLTSAGVLKKVLVTSTTQKPAGIAQIIPRVNSTLDMVSRLENSLGTKSPQAKEVAALPKLSQTVTAQELIALRDALSGFQYNGLYLPDSRVALEDLATDLEYIQIFNEAGVEGLNKYLETLVTDLRSAESKDGKAKIFNKLHMFIYRAICNFPHVIKGVEIILKPGAYERSEEFTKRFGSDYYRFRYKQLVDALQQGGREVTNSLTIELPYSFTTGTHGSGERAARGSSMDNLEFKTIESWEPEKIEKATGLGIAIEAPLITWHLSYFALDEIEAVRVTTSGNFTPYLKEKKILLDRTGYVYYYLCFRDFSKYSVDLKDVGKLSEQEARELRKFMVPLRVRNLFNDESGTLGNKSEKGFLAKVGELPDEVILYEIDNLKIGTRNSETLIDAYKLALRIIRDEIKDPSHVKVYTGDDVINRLTEINVEQRRF